ncbi:MAG TPA: glutamate-cysteine ligase family protein [Polyangiaceae bacterium LLY-WYZ-15_(1-7)]|nr:glutamate-cysteine ligase family protein [Polyangiaceae bacterium LLY-WYZ-15_(1-7)]HJL10744.1 glutamate-cysteine ligase family protein [Polyangiaceae bacterium LLY-WYZ-15_(1-7)]
MSLGLFQGFGVELEWMIVDAETLAPRPLAEALLREGDQIEDEREHGAAAWSNELAAHVIEVKTNGPAPRLEGVAALFEAQARAMNARLAPHGARLLGGALHPFFDPATATLWPHGQRAIYEAYDRIFGCRGHGWTNLQSQHLNLPFADDAELARLHAALRLMVPLVPGLAAASPFVDGRRSAHLDTRLEVYRHNQARVPKIAGRVVPEPVASRAAYEATILAPMYAAIAPLDPAGLLQEEWLNSRGVIARFDRMALELRVLDAQETPRADLAIAAAIVAVVRDLVEGRLGAPYPEAGSTERLAATLERAIRDGERAMIDDAALLRSFGLRRERATLGQLWRHLVDRCPPSGEHEAALGALLEAGPLARRMVAWVEARGAEAGGRAPIRAALRELAAEMAACLEEGRLLEAP